MEVLGAALIALGLYFVYRGRVGRRVGDAWHCRSCGYNLTGCSGVCPECGADSLKPNGRVRGQRQPSRWLAGSGYFVIVFGAVLVWGGISNFVAQMDWYHYAPLFVVEWDLKSGDLARVSRAARESQARLNGNELTPAHISRLLDVCLDVQSAPKIGMESNGIGDLLAKFRSTNALTPLQMDRYLAHVVHVGPLVLSPQVVKGKYFQFDVPEETRAAWNEFTVTFKPQSVVGPKRKPNPYGSAFGSSGSITNWGGGGSTVFVDYEFPESGTHTLEVTILTEVLPAGANVYATPPPTPLWSSTHKLTAEVNVLEQDPGPPKRRSFDPQLDQRLAKLIHLGSCRSTALLIGNQFRIEMDLGCEPNLPIAISLDVFFESDDLTKKLIPLEAPANSPMSHGAWESLDFDEKPSKPFSLRLVPSSDASASVLNLSETWDGELLFKDIDPTAYEDSKQPYNLPPLKPVVVHRDKAQSQVGQPAP